MRTEHTAIDVKLKADDIRLVVFDSTMREKEKKMKKSFLGIVFTILMTFTISAGAWADDASTGPPKPAGTTLEDIKNLLGLSIYLQGGYTYNFKNPDSQENDLRVFDHKANSFTLDLAQIVFTKDAPVGGVGYRLKLSAGETAKFIHDDRHLRRHRESMPFDLTEAYINYVAPMGRASSSSSESSLLCTAPR